MSSAVPTAREVSAARALAPWYLIEFLNSYACTTVLVCVPYFIKHGPIRGNVADSLWQSAGWGLMYIPYALLAGKLSDTWGPRTLLVRATMGTIPAAFAGLAAIFYPNLWLLFAVLTVFNLANTACWPALESAVARSPGRAVKLSTRMSVYNLGWSAGGFLAFATADLVMGPIDNRHWPAIFVVPAAACAIAAIIAVTATIPQSMLSHEHVSTHDADDAEAAALHVSPARAKSLLLMAWIGNTMAYVAGNVLIAVMPRVSIDYAALGSVWTFVRIGGFVALWLWPGWHYKLRYLLTAYFLLTASFFAMLFYAHPSTGTPLVVLIPAEAMFGLAASFIYASSLYYAMHVSSGGGSHAGTHEALIGLGVGLGCVVGALALSASTASLVPVAIAVTSILACGAIAISALAARRK